MAKRRDPGKPETPMYLPQHAQLKGEQKVRDWNKLIEKSRNRTYDSFYWSGKKTAEPNRMVRVLQRHNDRVLHRELGKRERLENFDASKVPSTGLPHKHAASMNARKRKDFGKPVRG